MVPLSLSTKNNKSGKKVKDLNRVNNSQNYSISDLNTIRDRYGPNALSTIEKKLLNESGRKSGLNRNESGSISSTLKTEKFLKKMMIGDNLSQTPSRK
jgi:hypothetical protein